MTLASMVREDMIFPDLPGSDRPSVLRTISERLVEAGLKTTAETLYLKLLEREELGSTCIGPSVAIPHCKLKGLDEVVISVGVCREDFDFGAEDGTPVRLLFTVISPEKDPAGHLQALAMISRWIKENSHVATLVGLQSRAEILAYLSSEVEEATA